MPQFLRRLAVGEDPATAHVPQRLCLASSANSCSLEAPDEGKQYAVFANVATLRGGELVLVDMDRGQRQAAVEVAHHRGGEIDHPPRHPAMGEEAAGQDEELPIASVHLCSVTEAFFHHGINNPSFLCSFSNSNRHSTFRW